MATKTATVKTEEKTPGTEVEVKKQGGALANLPAHLQGGARGLENVDASDMETPRIKLLQSSSPELDEYESAKAGHFWHTGLAQSLGKSIDIVAIFIDKRAVLWRPRHMGGGILARSEDMKTWTPGGTEFVVNPIKDNPLSVTWKVPHSVAASGLLEWGSSNPTDANSKPAATKSINVVAGFPDDLDMSPGVISLQNSAMKAAKKMIAGLQIARVPIYGVRMQVDPVQETNKEGQKYYNYRFTKTGYVEDADIFHHFEGLHLALAEQGLKFKEDEDEGDASVAAGGDAEDTGTKPKY